MQALAAFVYQAVRNCVIRTDTSLSLTSTHCQTAACKASAAMQPGRHACIPVIKAQTTAKQKHSNPLSKLIDANQSSSQLALHGPSELELITTSAMRTYGSASASCSYVHAFDVCTCAHHHMSFCDYAGPPKTQGEEGRSGIGHLLLIAWQPLHREHNSGYTTLIAIIDRPCRNPRLQCRATRMMNSLHLECKRLILLAAESTCQPVQKKCTHPQHQPCSPNRIAETVQQLSLARQQSEASRSLWLLKQAGRFA